MAIYNLIRPPKRGTMDKSILHHRGFKIPYSVTVVPTVNHGLFQLPDNDRPASQPLQTDQLLEDIETSRSSLHGVDIKVTLF